MPCKKEFPHLVEMHKKYGKDGLVIITVNLLSDPAADQEFKDGAVKFLNDQKAPFINLILNEDVDFWSQKFHTTNVPTTFVFNRAGKWKLFQPRDGAEGEFGEDVEKYVREQLKVQGGGG